MDRLLEHILKLREGRRWTEYKLAEESGIAQSTIAAWYSGKGNSYPTVNSLKKIANAFEINVSSLFIEGETVELTEQQRVLLNRWNMLNKKQRDAVIHLLDTVVENSIN